MPVAASFVPRLEILPPAQRRLWDELGATPGSFTLYGETALALRLGHRASVDFDFFSDQTFDPDRLASSVPYLRGAERIQVDVDTLTCRVDRHGPVLISFFGGLGLGQAAPSDHARGTGLSVASLLDIAGTKAAVIQKRAQAKDYVDIDALLRHGIDLPALLAAGTVVYGAGFNPLITLKALSYFEDVPDVAADVRERLSAAAAAVHPARIPVLTPYRARPATRGVGP